MRKHTLKKAPGYEVTYKIISPAQEQTHDQEPLDPGIEISDITLLGRRIGDVLFGQLLTANEAEWVGEILNELKRGKDGR